MKRPIISKPERALCRALGHFPSKHNFKYTPEAHDELLRVLFRALASNQPHYFSLLFPAGIPTSKTWSLKDAQGAEEGVEYTDGARGKACGHIFKSGETTYRCRTCSLDATCVLCSRCFDSSEHAGHAVSLSVSPGNSGCCDCGDLEAWKIPVACAIHTNFAESEGSQAFDGKTLPSTVIESVHATIARVLDYMCDVISCSPEHLRETKSEKGVRDDFLASNLNDQVYATGAEPASPDYSMILWNDEKHTISEVEEQLKKACRIPHSKASKCARDVADIGRAVIESSNDVKLLLHRSSIIEQIKITVTVRSSRDTFREQMCGTMIDWLTDISGCRVGDDYEILRTTICEEMLKSWRLGSSASNAMIGRNGIDDLEVFDDTDSRRYVLHLFPTAQENQVDDDDQSQEEGDEDEDAESLDGLEDMDIDEINDDDSGQQLERNTGSDTEMSGADEEDALETAEATIAGYPSPPPLATIARNGRLLARQGSDNTTSDSDLGEMATPQLLRADAPIPITPSNFCPSTKVKPAAHWLEKPKNSLTAKGSPVGEDLRRRVRLDYLLLFDLRLWKRARIGLRDLYISLVVTIPQFKRLLGLRLAAFYPTLAQLYLIADREPDHSIINLSLQILTTPSITSEVVERSNFLTNLLSIIYTFLTRRQVGHPHEVDAGATLAFEAGSLTNRRLYHFFMDLRYVLSSVHVQETLLKESRYILQFLDLVKLHQGICPNIRAVGEHVEYENDAWISASLITREINKLCRQFSEPFRWFIGSDQGPIRHAIRLVAITVMLNSLGLERDRFKQAEIKQDTVFKEIEPLEFDREVWNKHKIYRVVDFDLMNQAISFHHALHYTLSWFIDGAKSMDKAEVREILALKDLEFRPDLSSTKTDLASFSEEELSLALFDFPLRVCAWLAQMKAGIWVRNGLSLRHQSSTYRGVAQRDVAHQRDIFLLQSALVICDSSAVLMSMIDRFGMYEWCRGTFTIPPIFEAKQMIEVAEDFIHLLIILLTDRTPLLPTEDAALAQTLAIKRDLTHALCFKPLSYSELSSRLPDRYHEKDEFQELLDEMATYRQPEGLSDYGTFELKEEYYADLDPYIAHYNKNQRDESETAYRNLVAKRAGKLASEVVYEPSLLPIRSGLFKDLAGFTATSVFAQIIFSFLSFALDGEHAVSRIEAGRVEVYLQVVLHLTLIAVLEDATEEDEMSEESLQSFSHLALTKSSPGVPTERSTIADILQRLLEREKLDSCFPKINLILRRLKQRRPETFYRLTQSQRNPVDRMDTESPAITLPDEKELKRKRANESRAKVMAHFQNEQQKFMNKHQGIDWGVDDFSDADEDMTTVPQENVRKTWKFPSGTCIFCQDAVNEARIFGTFGMIINSNILRQTDFHDGDFVAETLMTPDNLDQSAESTRPFGVSGQNVEILEKMALGGAVNVTERRGLGKGFPSSHVALGPVSTGCGHLMHFDCFEVYYAATARRQTHQVARAHPERIDKKEFVCPLCKALGNAFLPIIWKSKTEEFPRSMHASGPFYTWLGSEIGAITSRMGKAAEDAKRKANITKTQEILGTYASQTFVNNLNRRQERHVPRNTHNLPISFTSRTDMSLTNFVTDSEFVEFHDLNIIYKRLRDTIRCNSLSSQFQYPVINQHLQEDLTFSDTLARSFGYSLSALEISQRGLQSDRGATWLQNVSDSSLIHLRILAETVFSYIAVGGLRNSSSNKSIIEFKEMQNRQLYQLFLGHQQIFDDDTLNDDLESLFAQDIFIFLAECTMFLIPAMNLEFHHIMRICYYAEIVKAVMALVKAMPKLKLDEKYWDQVQIIATKSSPNEQQALNSLISRIIAVSEDSDLDRTAAQDSTPLIYQAVRSYALPFLRKCVLLLHSKYHVDFGNSDISAINEPELERLGSLLGLPSLPNIFVELSEGRDLGIGRLMDGWITHWMMGTASRSKSGQASSKGLSLSHPAIFELVGLPETFDVLLEQVMRRRCPTTGKDMTDPSVCLFCGEIFCSQAFCCISSGSSKLGGCNQHVLKCGGQIGIFINIRKCCVLYLHQQKGSWSVAPYLDRHGETDPGLRRHNQLFLHPRRYDALLRAAWLNHTIPSTIARKMEADLNNGGWETI
ncbi:MAG: hypothetical protein M1814_005279 [Vezdaea aestivalis]|nr:MAG: hypothetical protein M1814_005279 [Vezdaea aestivalis]